MISAARGETLREKWARAFPPISEWQWRAFRISSFTARRARTLSARANLDMVHIDVTPPAEAGEGPSFLGGLLGGWGSTKDAAATPAERKDALPVPAK